jgi:hypothetical protein
MDGASHLAGLSRQATTPRVLRPPPGRRKVLWEGGTETRRVGAPIPARQYDRPRAAVPCNCAELRRPDDAADGTR